MSEAKFEVGVIEGMDVEAEVALELGDTDIVD